MDRAVVEAALQRLYVGEDAGLRDEDKKKARELAALLDDVARAAHGHGPFTIVDAAAGKAYVGLLAAALVAPRTQRPWRVVVVEREAARVAASRAAAAVVLADARVDPLVIDVVQADVSDAAAWPPSPDLVVALHACGAATDGVIDRAVAAQARRLLVVPCCYGAAIKKEAPKTSDVPGQDLAERWAHALGVPRQGAVSKRFSQALTDAERTLRLEAAGYEVEVADLVPPTVTPFHLIWRARLVEEPGRIGTAAEKLRRLRGGPSPPARA